MTAHTCTTYTPGCYRCELGRDEVEAQLADARQELREDVMGAIAEEFGACNNLTADAVTEAVIRHVVEALMCVAPRSVDHPHAAAAFVWERFGTQPIQPATTEDARDR
jgi:hypothetical protein